MPRGQPPSVLAKARLDGMSRGMVNAVQAGDSARHGELMVEMMKQAMRMSDQDNAHERALRDPSIRQLDLASNRDRRTFMNRASQTVVDAVNPLLDMFRNKPTFDEYVHDPNSRMSTNIEDRRAYDWGLPHYDPNHAPRREPWREWIDGSITGPLVSRR
jgi:hypothetical protein